MEAHNAAAATTKENRPQSSDGSNGLADVTNTGPGVVAAEEQLHPRHNEL